MDEQQHFIIKANGEKVLFDPNKIIAALQNSGANEKEAHQIVTAVKQRLYDGISSKKIYQMAYALLKKQSHRTAGKYRLKKAIFDLGPSGFPFEQYVARIFQSLGYQVQTGQHVEGKCISHEVDVVATKPGEKVIVECKFHSDYRGRTNVQVPLYIHSRFNDIRAKWEQEGLSENIRIRGFVVTNSRFTSDAIQFAECVGLGMVSWDYPAKYSLKYLADKSALYPLTSLHSLLKSQKKALLEKNIILCRDLPEKTNELSALGMTEKQVQKVLNEARQLAQTA